MTNKLLMNVSSVMQEEYKDASEIHGSVHSSDHESFAVLLEEMEEATSDLFDTRTALNDFWELVKDDESTPNAKLTALAEVRICALFAACEFIQVAAMAHKAEITIQTSEGCV